MKSYDLVVIGSGPAGEKGAAQAAYFGRSVALVEKKPMVGGACVNTGTIPSKTLRETALHLSGFRKRDLYGIDLSIRKNISVGEFMYRKGVVVEREWELIEDNLRRHDIDRLTGSARFVSHREIEVVSDTGTERVRGDIFLIATGSSPFRPDSVPFDDELIYDSDSILHLDRLPERLAVVGAGVIGCEYASIFAALGIEVLLIDGRSELLAFIDREICEVLLRSFRDQLGIRLLLGSGVTRIERLEDSVVLHFENGRREETVDRVLYAAGRQSNVGDLDLAAAGVETGERGVIPVDESYRTNVPNVYAAGDVIGFPALASTSMEQARVAMVHAFDLKYKTRVAPILPYGIYTIPELSTVGMTEREAVTAGIPFEVGRAWYRNNARGLIVGDTDGLIKLVFRSDDLKLLGVHIVGENASELLHVGMMVMQFGGTIGAFIESVFNFPTIGEAYKYAAYDGLGNVSRSMNESSSR